MPPAGATGASGPQAAGHRSAAREHLMQVLGPVVAAAGFDLEDVSVTAAGRRSVVRVTVDADGGLDLDAVAEVSRAVSDAIDADAALNARGALAGAYVLEVSSPGVDRPLTEPRHWRRATGRLVTVAVADTVRTGRVSAVDDEGVTLDVAGAAQSVPWAELGRGRVQVEFARADSDTDADTDPDTDPDDEED